jgi:glycosyltransferase involved in cell wall biosynthesis
MKFPDLLFVSLENWDEVWRRNQFLCSGLAQRFPESKILFVGLPRDVSNAVRRRDFSALKDNTTQKVPGYPNITVTRPLKFAPNTLSAGRHLNERMFRSHVRRVATSIGMKKPLLWLNPHSAVHMAGLMGESAVIYDITDDWILASCSPREKQLIQEQDRHLCQRADLTVVCSAALHESRKAASKRILLLPNGVNLKHYQQVDEKNAAQSSFNLPGPVFGYTGTLHDDRIDAEPILALARAFPGGSVVLVGPDFLSDETKAQLAAQPNVHLGGTVPYAGIAATMQQFDVCIVPHHESDFTNSLNPIKLWEYLACGKPIVSTNVAGFRDYPQFVRLASGPDDFVAACRDALQEGDSLTDARRAEAAGNSWDSRLDQLLDTLKSLNIVRT